MVRYRKKTTDEIMDGLGPENKEITEKLRRAVKNTIPDANETVKQGRITYVLNQKDFASIRITQSHVDLLFLCGTSCESHLLHGRGSVKDPRHVKINKLSELDDPEFKRLLKEAETTA